MREYMENRFEGYLYHYTSLERLAQILETKTIYLGPLNRVDDLQENKTEDVSNLGQFFFTSCWTAEEKEIIPMWEMYTPLKSGVRIGLPKNPFVTYKTPVSELRKLVGGFVFFEGENEETISSCVDILDMIKKGVLSPQAMAMSLLFEVKYTNDKCLLEPHVKHVEGEKLQLNMECVGKYKNEYWSFQKEWRYIIQVLPLDLKQPVQNYQNNFNIIANLMAAGQLKSPIDHVDLKIAPEIMPRMVIMTSPKFTIGNRIMLDALLEKYNPNATIMDSELVNLL